MEKKPQKYDEIINRVVKPSERFQTISEDPYVAEGRLVMPYRYFAGTVGSRFLTALRDEQKIMGLKCPACHKVYVPPRLTCGACFRNMDEWVEVKNQGTVLSYTAAHYPSPVHPAKEPVIYAIIQLDGADTGLTHIIGEADPVEVRIGMRVRAVFRDEREGNILDIRHFAPV